MTPLQIERIQKKIAKIKRELAADKKRHGGYYDDSRGLRYLPPGLYLKLSDYKSAMRYFRWFAKNFDDDSGYPTFLFEWCITLYKNGKISEAENLVLITFFSNTYLLDAFLGKEISQRDIEEQSNWQGVEMLEDFPHSHNNSELSDFATWLNRYIQSDKFQHFSNEFLAIKQKLSDAPAGISRSEMVESLASIIDKFMLR